ncbi:anthranilate synthase family protein [Streptomyces sp. NPDC003758]
MTYPDLLDALTGPTPPAAFALLHRPETAAERIDLLTGTLHQADALAEVPLPAPGGRARHEALVLLPYRQIAERGFEAPDDGAPLTVMSIEHQASAPVGEVLDRLPDVPLSARDLGFDLDDDAYADAVRRVVDEEIGTGAGANFVLKRTFVTQFDHWSPQAALALFKRLLRHSAGAYWTFLIHTGERTLLGASPERHITLDAGTAVMNPISGTYRYPESGPSAEGLLEFLADRKEANELYMVVDEELKMMSRICEGGGRVVGPRLRAMDRLAHTEYFVEGHSRLDVRTVLHETLFAPTVTGSPLESACRVISKYEPDGRGYYAGVAALIGRDAAGERALDTAILIRTAEVDAAGTLRLSVGATLVRDSDPYAEAAETRAKAAGLLAVVHGDPGATAAEPGEVSPAAAAARRLSLLPAVALALSARNEPLAPFWRADPRRRRTADSPLAGLRALFVDAEDTFTAMGADLMRALGLEVVVRRFDEAYDLDGNDLVVVGPGPGDPRDTAHPKIAHMRALTGELLRRGTPFLSVCLGHQILSSVLGLELVRKDVPNQGVQRTIDLFGHREDVYFYNTFTAVSAADTFPGPAARPGPVQVARDPATGEVHGLRGAGFASVQFHPESVMSRAGVHTFEHLVSGLFPARLRSPLPYSEREEVA